MERLTITGTPSQRLGEEAGYTILRVVSVGVNNLPSRAAEALAELFGPIPELLHETVRDLPPDFDLAIAQARKAGYANWFEAVVSDVAWRPVLPGSDGRAHLKPTAHGTETAIVAGPEGGDASAGADVLGARGAMPGRRRHRQPVPAAMAIQVRSQAGLNIKER